MGQEIEHTNFNDEHRREFKERLRNETNLLRRHFSNNELEEPEVPLIGLEVEACLIDDKFNPAPKNEDFLKKCDHDLVVHELSQFNFEINVDPLPLSGNCFGRMQKQLESIWGHSKNTAKALGINPFLTGILPTLEDSHLGPLFMTKSNRYKALNEQLFHLRKEKPLKINIEAEESLRLTKKDIMLEAAATSIQVHLQVNPSSSCQYYNASVMASAPIVAVAANSPFLYGQNLWDETRIPVFEQAVEVITFRDWHGQDVGRVTFGTNYARKSLFEFFLENLDGYPPLIPLLFDAPPEELSHLKFHNGTIWRWNRPIIGHSKGTPHVRLEQRVMASGPSVTDIMANMAFYLGVCRYLAKEDHQSMNFDDAKSNFYQCAKKGLNAEVNWFGQIKNISDVIEEVLIPEAKKALIELGVDREEVHYYLDEVMLSRVKKRQNGANWQKSFVSKYGKDFNALISAYLENEELGLAVHQWTL